MKEIKIKAPAKINLGLNVVSKRDDGYHNIETIFYPVDLADIITIKESDKFLFTTDCEELSSKDNLIIKAKDLLEKEINKEINVHIHLEKKIPIGGGLGGGSSDAAAVLKYLSKLFSPEIDENKLKALALKLGSDVPFFLDPKPCYAYSRGELMERRNFKINFPLIIVNPGIQVSTKWAYENIIPSKPNFKLEYLTQEHFYAPAELHKFLKNDFEEIVTQNFPEIAELKKQLINSGALLTLMSGSGSTFFSFYEDDKTAEVIKDELSESYFTWIQKP